jgi:hypothetical protein
LKSGLAASTSGSPNNLRAAADAAPKEYAFMIPWDLRRVLFRSLCGCLTLGLGVCVPQSASAQGCLLTRNTAPVLGTQLSPYLRQGEWQASVNYRQFTADHQYQGTELSPAVTALGTQVISRMRAMELSGTYAVTAQLNVSVGVPLMLRATSNRALPSTRAGSPRFEHGVTGVGDVLIGARYWFLGCEDNPTQNVSIGVALKTPTGESGVTDSFPNALGQDVRVRPVDQSIQLGDGGWGFNLSAEAFKQFGPISAFASGVYLFTPKDQNRTLSPPALLNPLGPEAVDIRQRFNTVSDSYLVRAGVGVPVTPVGGLSVTFAGRIEGVPITDALGDTAGFRRPGYYVALEPGVIYGAGRTTLYLSVPIRVHQNVQPSLGFPRDSTFAGHMLLAGASVRLGAGI